MNEQSGVGPASGAEQRHRVANLFQLLSTLTRMRQQRSSEPETKRQLGWLLDALGALGVQQHRMGDDGACDFAEVLTDMQAQLAEQSKGFTPEMWSQYLNMQSPMMQGMMGNYVEQSKSMFVQMQEQMQKQTEKMIGAFGVKR